MFKLIKKILLIMIAVILIGLSMFIYTGYQGYEDAVNTVSIQRKVEEIEEKESYRSLSQVSPYFLKAVVSIEDRRFYTHEGIDYIAIVRSTISNLVNKKVVGGGSTITQQLAKGMYFDHTPSYTRKISEAFVANDLENLYSKDEILELYINNNYYGDGYYGIYDASMGYFGVAPDQLSLAQAALLAGLPQAPSRYALSNGYDKALRRQEDVLNAMLECKAISKEEYIQALSERLQ